jgi:hypothetical protein
MRILFDGEPEVHYGQIHVESDPDSTPDGDGRGGQSNGLCGAELPGYLCLTTGLHTGHVRFTVELHDEPPHVDEAWEEVVEVSFRPTTDEVSLVQWAAEDAWPRADHLGAATSVPQALQQAAALPALFAAVDPDPLRAALDALFATAYTFGPAYHPVFDEARDLLR